MLTYRGKRFKMEKNLDQPKDGSWFNLPMKPEEIAKIARDDHKRWKKQPPQYTKEELLQVYERTGYTPISIDQFQRRPVLKSNEEVQLKSRKKGKQGKKKGERRLEQELIKLNKDVSARNRERNALKRRNKFEAKTRRQANKAQEKLI